MSKLDLISNHINQNISVTNSSNLFPEFLNFPVCTTKLNSNRYLVLWNNIVMSIFNSNYFKNSDDALLNRVKRELSLETTWNIINFHRSRYW